MKLAHRVGGTFARVPGILDPAVGHLVCPEGGGLVDGDAAELEPVGGGERGEEVAREDPRLEPVARPVGELDRLVEVVVGRDVQTGRTPPRIETFRSGAAFAITVGRTSLFTSSPPVRISARPRVPPRSRRAHARAHRRRSAGRRRSPRRAGRRARAPRPWGGGGRRARRRRRVDVDPLHGDAALAGEGERVRGEAGRHVLQVGVGLDEHRRRIPELELHLLARRALGQLPADVARPVKVIARMRSSATSTSSISDAGPTSTFSQPGGRPASVSSSRAAAPRAASATRA